MPRVLSAPLVVGVVVSMARVAAAATFSCDNPGYVQCAHAARDSRCACDPPEQPCACVRDNTPCATASGEERRPGLVCNPISTCALLAEMKDNPAWCRDQMEGETCGAVETGICGMLEVACDPNDGGVDHVTIFTCITNGGPNAAYVDRPSDAGEASAAPAGKDDSGCATAPGTTTLPLLGGAVGVGLLSALRRRRSRKKD